MTKAIVAAVQRPSVTDAEFEASLTIARYDLIPSLTYSGLGFIVRNTKSAIGLPVAGATAPLPSESTGSTTFSTE